MYAVCYIRKLLCSVYYSCQGYVPARFIKRTG